ncbi:MAG TPA: hypothetical protein DIV86_02335 [Alphaproteobacteria bacterium]|nr:hypothetical protein [Alphaproteobacteria bacterium]
MSTLTQTLTANGNTNTIDWYGGVGTFAASGTFGGGIITMQYSLDGTNFITGGVDSELVSDGGKKFSLPKCSIRLNLAGATSPNVNCFIR